jgi:4-oxalocrotonate tautomerase
MESFRVWRNIVKSNPSDSGKAMPILILRVGKGHPLETKRRLASSLTRAVTDVLDLPPDQVTVLIEEFERDNWATGGELLIDGAAGDRGMPARQDIEALFRKPPATAKAPPRKAKAKSPRRR